MTEFPSPDHSLISLPRYEQLAIKNAITISRRYDHNFTKRAHVLYFVCVVLHWAIDIYWHQVVNGTQAVRSCHTSNVLDDPISRWRPNIAVNYAYYIVVQYICNNNLSAAVGQAYLTSYINSPAVHHTMCCRVVCVNWSSFPGQDMDHSIAFISMTYQIPIFRKIRIHHGRRHRL